MKRASIVIPSILPLRFRKAHAIKHSKTIQNSSTLLDEKKARMAVNSSVNFFILKGSLKEKSN